MGSAVKGIARAILTFTFTHEAKTRGARDRRRHRVYVPRAGVGYDPWATDRDAEEDACGVRLPSSSFLVDE